MMLSNRRPMASAIAGLHWQCNRSRSRLDQRVPAANRRASCRTKFCESCLNFKVGCDFPTIDRGHCIIHDLQFFPGCEIVSTLQFALDLLCNGNKFVLSLFRPGLNSLQKVFQVRRGHNEIVSRRRCFPIATASSWSRASRTPAREARAASARSRTAARFRTPARSRSPPRRHGRRSAGSASRTAPHS